MVAENFEPSLQLVLEQEGGNDDDPHDHGGRTSRGITQREYNAYCAMRGSSAGDVWQATDLTVKTIYHISYWNPWGDLLPLGIDYVFFDDCVNSGQSAATKHLQRALGVIVDGHFGVVTMHAVQSNANRVALIEDFCEARRRFYRGLEQFPRYGHGWLNRVAFVEQRAKEMIA